MNEGTRKIFDLCLDLSPAERSELAQELLRSAGGKKAVADEVREAVSTYDPFPSRAGASPLAFTLEYWQDQEWFVGRLKEVPGVFSQGESLAELEDNIRDAYELMTAEPSAAPEGQETRRKRFEVA